MESVNVNVIFELFGAGLAAGIIVSFSINLLGAVTGKLLKIIMGG